MLVAQLVQNKGAVSAQFDPKCYSDSVHVQEKYSTKIYADILGSL